jgi:hypothetical protein
LSTRILAVTSPGEIRVAAVVDGHLVDYAIWRPGAPDGVGDLHRGRVEARVPALGGAFVAIEGAEGFLPDTEGGAGTVPGETIGVRVTRAAQGGKGPRLTARLEPEEGAMIGSGPPWRVRPGPGGIERLAKLHPQASVIVDDPALAAMLRPALGGQIDLSRAPVWEEPLASEIAALEEPWAVVPGGGRLSVHPTPALTAIDLDAGASASEQTSKTRGHSALNNAAVPVLARQIRLRNLGGAILVDWAGLPVKRRLKLGPALAAALAADPLRPRLLGFTALGLAEIVRPRVHPPLHEMLAGPHAAGLAGLRDLAAQAAAAPGPAYALRAAPPVAAALAADAVAQADVRRLTGRDLILRTDPMLRANEWEVEFANA